MRFLRMIFLLLLLIIILLIVTGAAVFIDTTRAPLPVIDGNVSVPGLTAQVEVLRDSYGVPHVYASNLYDLYFAQGFTQAQDRWWQMEFFRHVARGSIQELTGKQDHVMGTDIFLRTVGLYRAAERDYASIGEEGKAFVQAFTDGVNSYILNRAADDLAMEYRLLGVTGANIAIEGWSPVDSIAWGKVISWQLTDTYDHELERAALLDAVGTDMMADFAPDFPYGRRVTILHDDDLPLDASSLGTPTGAAVSSAIRAALPADAAQTNEIYVAGGVRAGEELASVGLISSASDAGVGSNNWVATGDMTVDGLPLLANDPHLGIAMPSIWYEIGLHCLPVTEDCPLDIVGFTFAATPGLITGHNAHIAWGITNVGADVQDLYRIRVNPDNPLQYEWNGEWRDMNLIETSIQFADDEPPLTLQIRETHLGPIINENDYDETTGTLSGFNNVDPLALRWTGHDTSQLWEAVIGLNFAQDWDDFRAALSIFDIPSQNFVYADTAGNIGYQTPGRIPIRAPGHNGQLPVDGWTDAFEWRGYVPFNDMPRIYNPVRNYIVTANQAVTPLAYYDQLAERYGDANYVFTSDWASGFRGQRIDDLLNQMRPHNTDTFKVIQTDNLNMPAQAILPYVLDLFTDDPALAEVRDWLRDYNGVDTIDNPRSALVNLFLRALVQNTFADQLPDSVNPSNQQIYAIEIMLDQPDNLWWNDVNTSDVIERRDDILLRSLRQANERAAELMGNDRNAWTWGALHTATFISNPLGASGINIIEDIFNRGPYPANGGYEVVNATSWSVNSDELSVSGLPSYRMIVDLSDFDASWSIHTTGASSHPYSPYYDNLTNMWLRLEYKPMLFTRRGVELGAEHRLLLIPAD